MTTDHSVGPGDRVGHYVVDGPLGRGGMGIVVRAFDARLDRWVALKLVDPVSAGGTAARDRLRKEARALALLSHPNVVPVFDVGLHEGSVWIAMELVDGVDLSQWLACGPRPHREVVRVFLDAAHGLAAAHRAGLVHRDFKPSNVLLGADGRARIVDFGLARASAAPHSTDEDAAPSHRSALGSTSLTDDGIVMGTAHYMAPEQHYGAPVGPAADQYAFCVSLWEALYGERPFAGRRSHDLVAAKRSRPEHPPEGSDVPSALFDVVARGLQPEPERRFAGMGELVSALERTQRSRRRFWAPALAVAAIGVVVVQLVGTERTCDGGRRADAVWNDHVAESLERSFAATERAYAAEASSRTASALDEWFAGWTSTFDEVCRTASDTDLDHAMACLDARMRAAQALLAVLADGDPETIAKAVGAARGLAAATACADPELWRSATPVPTDPERRDAVQGVRDEIARAHALMEAGRYPEGLEAATRAFASAQTVGFAPVEAEALDQLASLQAQNADRVAAVASYERAYFLASEAGHDLAAAEAAIGVAWLHSENVDLETAAQWTVHARSSLDRAGGNAALEAELENAKGGIASHKGAWDEALAHYARVPELVGERDLLAFAALFNAGVVYLRRDDNVGAKRSFTAAIELGTRVLGPWSPQVGRARELLGITLGNDGELDAAIAEQRLAVAILERGLGAGHGEVAGALMNLARQIGDSGDGAEALRLYQRALAIAEEHEMTGHVCSVLNNMGFVLAELGYFDAARVHLERSLVMHEREYGAQNPEVAYPLMGLGGVAQKLARHREALGYYERVLALTATGGNAQTRARAMQRIADVEQAQGKLSEALRLHREALAAHERIDGHSEIDVADALTDIGETLVAMRRPTEARPVLERAVDLYGSDRGTPPARAQAQYLLGQVLWAEPADRARARRMIEDAARAYGSDGARSAEELANVEAWLRDHAS